MQLEASFYKVTRSFDPLVLQGQWDLLYLYYYKVYDQQFWQGGDLQLEAFCFSRSRDTLKQYIFMI